jgi:hypothetical protein
MLRSPRPHDILEPRLILMQDVAVEKQQRAQRLVLRRRRHPSFDGERAEKLRDLRRPHFDGMALAVKQDVSADPRDVGLLGAAAPVAQPVGLAHAIQQPAWATNGPVDLGRHS